jgi:predicted nucleic acid-binding protein
VTLYLDASALVKLLVAEEGSEAVRASAAEATALATSRVTYVEIHSALARMLAGGRLTRRVQQRQLDAFHALWQDAVVVPVDEPLVERAAQLAQRHALRGFDALQLASAVELLPAGGTRFASWDERLNVAAARERLELIPV